MFIGCSYRATSSRSNSKRTLRAASSVLRMELHPPRAGGSRPYPLDDGVFGAAWKTFQASGVNREAGSEFGDLLADALFSSSITHVPEHVGDPRSDLLHFGFAHPARRYRRGSQADAARLHRRQWIEGNGILVDGNARAVERFFRVGARQSAGVQLDQK